MAMKSETWEKNLPKTLPLICLAISSLVITMPAGRLNSSPLPFRPCKLSGGCGGGAGGSVTEPNPLIDLVSFPTPSNTNSNGIGTYLGPELGLVIDDTNDLDQVKAAGFTFVKRDARWSTVEGKQKGVRNNFSVVDDYASHAAANNLKMVWILCCGNTLYATAGNPNGYPITSNIVAGFVGYVQALVKHLPPGQRYEIYNEPDSPQTGNLTPAQYAALANAVIPAIKAIDPTAKVTTSGPGGWFDTPYLASLFAAGFPKPGVVPDGIGVHAYLYPYMDTKPPHNDGDPELLFTPTYPAQYNKKPYHAGYVYTWQAWEDVKSQYNIKVPTWDTEAGINIDNLPNYNTDPLLKPRLTVRHLLVRWAAGFPLQALYAKSVKTSTENYCFLCSSNNIKAVSTLTNLASGHKLTGFTLDNSLLGSSSLNFFKMENSTNTIYIMWVRQGNYSLTGIPYGTSGYDMLGNKFTTNGPVAISATKGPIYLVSPGN